MVDNGRLLGAIDSSEDYIQMHIMLLTNIVVRTRI
jgi:hypothetical protein